MRLCGLARDFLLGLEARDDDRHVVVAAAVEGLDQENVAGVFRVGVLAHQFGDVGVGEHVGDAVGAQEEAVAGFDGGVGDLGVHAR